MFTDTVTRNHRQSICDSCESKKGVRCAECGCFLMFLRKIDRAECPLKKW